MKLSRKDVKLGYNKNCTVLALDCIYKNSKEIISISEIKRRDGNKIYKISKRAFMNAKEYY